MLGEYTKEDGKKLLLLARESIEEEFTGKKPEKLKEKQFKQARGVFVTLTEKGKLRGCVGFPYPNVRNAHKIRISEHPENPTNKQEGFLDFPVNEAVYKAAKEAAFSDFRFTRLKEEEMKNIEIEISILTYPEECEVKDVKVGKDGLMCNYLGYQGLLLPQVAVENNMNKHEFLECLCMKAGLNTDKWKDTNFKLLRFQCQIFSEE